MIALAVALCCSTALFQTPVVDRQDAAAPQPRETIVSIQIHGNTATSDEEIKRLAGIEVGAPVTSDTIQQVTRRLQDAKRFERVEVLKRFASIEDASQIVLVVIVDEGPVSIEKTQDPNQPTRVVRNRGPHLLFLPVLNYEDGYGLTYGARLAWPEPLGKQSRIAFPLTWGAEKRAAAEFDKTWDGGLINRITGGVSVSERTNPFFDVDDSRVRVWARGERDVRKWLRTGATIGWQRVSFPTAAGDVSLFPYGGADVVFDTRIDPILPRNAVYARAAWEHIDGANRGDFDTRGYVGLFGQTVLALRGQASVADRPLPPFLKPLLGGMPNLRGFAVGTDAGDNLVAASAELIVPLTSPLSFGRIGVTAFVDEGTAFDDGQRFADQPWHQGIGGSVWLSAAFFRISVAVAHGRDASTRVHVGANVTF
ncbi:MAG TPA: BamA/TamA family outer membrane protein [Vicinamibacterales bacterium]